MGLVIHEKKRDICQYILLLFLSFVNSHDISFHTELHPFSFLYSYQNIRNIIISFNFQSKMSIT